MRSTESVRFIFIAGVEGSGTTLMSRLLAAPKSCASLGGLYVKTPPSEDATRLVEKFQTANRVVWDREASFSEKREARRTLRAVWQQMLGAPSFAGITHFVFKRSFPFGNPHGRHVPNLQDIDDIIGNVQFTVMYRDPRAASYSTLRRGFDNDLRRLAVLCSEHLTLLSAQAQTIPESRLKVVSYSELCLRPAETTAPLIASFELDRDAVYQGIERELPKPVVDERYRRELGSEQVAWLDEFFDKRRQQQWSFLSSTKDQ